MMYWIGALALAILASTLTWMLVGPSESPPESDVGARPTAPRNTHTVNEGETLGQIASRYGVRVDQLIKWNDLTCGELSVGQTLYVEPEK